MPADISSARSVQPLRVTGNVILAEDFLLQAFSAPISPDKEDLFFQLFSPQWDTLAPSEKLLILSKICAAGEAVEVQAQEAAAQLTLTASTPLAK